MSAHRIVIAGTGSGVGKTTFTIGLMAALQQKGYIVQGFKCGPDYIDPTFHTAVTGRTSRNLDSWMFNDKTLMDILERSSRDSDISIIEGVMGFYDGKSPIEDRGSTAEISILTKSPVLLIVNCASMARSVAAIVKGFQLLNTNVNIVGIIANQVGSEGHFKMVKAAVEQECGIPVVGYLKKEQNIHMPSRQLGLIPAIERGELQQFFYQLGVLINATVDVDKIYELSSSSELPTIQPSIFEQKENQHVKIAVAKDAAFNFYYEENIELLKANGATIEYFAPLDGETVPSDADGLYIGGGFPEEFAKELSEQTAVKDSIHKAISSGLPTLAECGGFMFLTEAIYSTEGERFEMAGCIPGTVQMQKKRAALGYREIFGTKGNFLIEEGQEAKGHEFHYSIYSKPEDVPHAYETKSRFRKQEEGYMHENLIAGYTHFHFASNPILAIQWIEQCKKYQKKAVISHY
ncbi:cobyrinate a,c-diamide synthase [uncultured Rummeliibacillus sp.]|uniref:cobyrinate a,c-diamide synthase n=1 Tax=uncultured Rummeliibacillus sp. TaxID=762292 RepID=UPI002614C332|nr:cobyrinate a,c-diamide synthase [uncultured Rummeliibacillus sp.]